jgi:hypothetical protein
MENEQKACKHCGQTLMLDGLCDCPDALTERQYNNAAKDIDKRFGNSAEEPLPEEIRGKVIRLLEMGAELVHQEMIEGITVQITGSIKADIKPDKYGAAKVTRENKIKF